MDYNIAIVQMQSAEDKEKNLHVSKKYIKEAKHLGASLACFPEFQMAYSPSSQSADELYSLSETLSTSKFVKELSICAKENEISVIATIYEKSSEYPKVFDTAIYINREGKCVANYRKIHLYDALGFKESIKLKAGNLLSKIVSDNFDIGMMICYDVRFPEISRILSLQGAKILVIPSAWVHGIMKEEHWQIMLRARAIENGVYIIAPDQIGNIYSGRSMVIDPFGSIILDLGNDEGVSVTKISTDRIQQVRTSLPLLQNRRVDVYSSYIDTFTNLNQ